MAGTKSRWEETNLAKGHLEEPRILLKLGEVGEVAGGEVVLEGNADQHGEIADGVLHRQPGLVIETGPGRLEGQVVENPDLPLHQFGLNDLHIGPHENILAKLQWER